MAVSFLFLTPLNMGIQCQITAVIVNKEQCFHETLACNVYLSDLQGTVCVKKYEKVGKKVGKPNPVNMWYIFFQKA
jgi:hypothetical protein